MKGSFYKDQVTGEQHEIISEPMPVRNEDGYDTVMVVVKKLRDNTINLEDVICITRVETAADRVTR